MVALAVTVVLATYVLGAGRRWIAPVLGAGVVALLLATWAAGGVPRTTARADLTVQVLLLGAVALAFAGMHRHLRRIPPAGGAPAPADPGLR